VAARGTAWAARAKLRCVRAFYRRLQDVRHFLGFYDVGNLRRVSDLCWMARKARESLAHPSEVKCFTPWVGPGRRRPRDAAQAEAATRRNAYLAAHHDTGSAVD